MSPTSLTLHRYNCINQGYTEDLGDGVSLTLMLIPDGEFMMGAPKDEPDSVDRERPQHLVRVSRFLMGRYPVTQAQWRVVAGYEKVDRELTLDPSNFKGDDLPVEGVSWYDAVEFCQRLSRTTGKNYHLPSEAQWEYACQAETETVYHFGDEITKDLANYLGEQTTPVGQYPANRWELYDLHGNVWEWCQDYWHENYEGAPTDGSGWIEGGESNRRVRRGGSWYDDAWFCRSACRDWCNPDGDYDDVGFRVCCSPPRAVQ